MRILGAVVSVILLAACGPEGFESLDTTEQLSINRDPDFLVVWTNNIENLKEPGENCPGDWQDLIWAMKDEPKSPDLFLVQQLNGAAQARFLAKTMSERLVGIYDFVIAEADPETVWYSHCGREKHSQTNAIIYRVGRFDPIAGSKQVWKTRVQRNDGACEISNHSRSRSVLMKFRDKIAKKDVSVASIHWPLYSRNCADENAAETRRRLSASGGDMLIFGGDGNVEDRSDDNDFRPWYRQTVAALNGEYKDPIYAKCAAADRLHACLNDNHTTAKRIDYLFASGPNNVTTSAPRKTLDFAEADASARKFTGKDSPLNYSDHRAVFTYFHY
jgi:hypothetical protein